MTLCQTDLNCKGKLNAQYQKWVELENLNTDTNSNIEDELSNTNNINSSQLKQFKLSNDFLKNDLVKGAINEWLTWKRPQLINTWKYYQFLRNDILPSINRYDLEESFVLAIMAQESGGRVHSNSVAGAGGLFQIMPATAKRLGISGKIGAYDLRYSPKESARAAALYIHQQSQLHSGDKTKILAAYNSGENRFARLNKKHKNKSIWDKNFYYDLPRETRHYIPTVIAAMLIYRHPEQFNVVFNELETDITKVQFQQKSSLSELAICLGQESNESGWFRVLRNLNFSIKADKLIPARTELIIPKSLKSVFQTNCQNKDLMKLAQSLHEADFNNSQTLFKYKVKEGESLGLIANKFSCTSKREIAKLNNLKAPRYLIRAGKYLKIPQC